mgnify:FL=1
MLIDNAPVSKVLVIACSIASLLGGTRAAKGCSLSYQASKQNLHVFRFPVLSDASESYHEKLLLFFFDCIF